MTLIAPQEPEEPTQPVAEQEDRLLDIQQYLHRFDRSQTVLMVVRTYIKPSGEHYTRRTFEPWLGL